MGGGGRKRRKRQNGRGEWQPPAEPVARLLAIDPTGRYVIASVGENLRGVDLREKVQVEFKEGEEALSNCGSFRAAAFSECGMYFLTGGDDKTSRVWDTETWKCINKIQTPKKVSAGSFSPDSGHCFIADKFGDVYCTKLDPDNPTLPKSPLFGHYCSTITSLTPSPDGHYIITTDRDNKVRVSNLPTNPLLGCHEIQAYCMGHKSFVVCSTLAQWDGKVVLVTGGGDGQVCFWDHVSGQLLGSFLVAGEGDQDGSCSDGSLGGEDERPLEMGKRQAPGRIVVSLAACSDRPLVAMGVEGVADIFVLKCEMSDWTIALHQKLSLDSGVLPCCLRMDRQSCLWIAGGPLVPKSTELHITAAKLTGDGMFEECKEDEVVLFVRKELECRSGVGTGVEGPTATASLGETLGKKVYVDHEAKKRSRADKREELRSGVKK